MAQLKPNPKLLSLLEQLTNPIQQLNFKINFNGVFSFPDEWRITDDQNQGVFTYQIRYLNYQIEGGKIYPREMTDKEKRELEEQQNLKSKKGTKKEGKDQQLTPEEEERLQKQRQQEEEEEKAKLQYFESLSHKEQIFYNQEDRFKNPQLRFEDGKKQHLLDGKSWQNLEDCIQNTGGIWIYLVRLPAISEEEIAKIKKGKPKNLNLAELQPINFKSWLSLKDFQDPGVAQTTQRCSIQQIDETVDVPKFNVDKTYIKVNIEMDPPPTVLIEEVKPTVNELFESQKMTFPKAPSRTQCLNNFQMDVTLAMWSLSDEYQTLFSKDQQEQKQKQTSTMTIQKKQELQKKKEQFLLEINQSGKYKLLKDRLRNSIVRVCIDKFQKEGLYSGVTKDDKDRLFAELYVYMMEEMQKTLGEFITTNKEEIHEDLSATYEQNIKDRDRVYASLTQESAEDRYQRLANEYELLIVPEQSTKYYNNLLSIDPLKPEFLIAAARYHLRIQNFKEAEQLVQRAINAQPQNFEFLLLLSVLLTRRGRYKEAIKILQELLKHDPINTLYNNFIHYLYKFNGEERTSEKYKHVTERIYMRTRGLLNTRSSRNIPQDPHQLPNLRQQTLELQEMAKRAPQLTNEQQDMLQIELIEYLAKNNIMDLVEIIMQNIIDKTTIKMTILKAQVHYFKKQYPEALAIFTKVLESNPRNYDVHIMKGTLCYECEQFYEAEETFLKAIRIRQNKSFSIYLRLGYMYLKRKSWEDAKLILSKALEQAENSSLCWLGLGIATLRLGELKLAEECFYQANIFEPFSGEVWGYIALLCLQVGHREQQANQAITRLDKTEINDIELLEELSVQFQSYKNYEQSKRLQDRIILLRLKQQQNNL